MAFKLDFEKMRDPEWQAEVRAKQEAMQAEAERKEAELRTAIDLCFEHYENLPSNERSLVSSCRYKLLSCGLVTEKQATWLFDIAKRLQPGN